MKPITLALWSVYGRAHDYMACPWMFLRVTVKGQTKIAPYLYHVLPAIL